MHWTQFCDIYTSMYIFGHTQNPLEETNRSDLLFQYLFFTNTVCVVGEGRNVFVRVGSLCCTNLSVGTAVPLLSYSYSGLHSSDELFNNFIRQFFLSYGPDTITVEFTSLQFFQLFGFSHLIVLRLLSPTLSSRQSLVHKVLR